MDVNILFKSAIESGLLDIVRNLIDSEEISSETISNCLTTALQNKNNELILMLLSCKNIELSYEHLKIAVEMGLSNIVEIILANSSFRDIDFNYLIEISRNNQDLDTLQVLIKNSDNVRKYFNYISVDFEESRSSDMIKIYLRDSRFKNYQDVLFLACFYDYEDIVRFLLNLDVIPNNRDLNVSIEQGNIDISKLLLKNPGLDLSSDNSIITALQLGYTDIVEIILERPDVNPSIDHNDALAYACYEGHLSIVKSIVNHPKFVNDDLESAVNFILKRDRIEILEYLDTKLNLSLSEYNISIALEYKSYNVIRYLINKNQNIDLRRLLRIASEDGILDLVKFSLDNIQPGRDVDNNFIAVARKGNPELINLFKEYYQNKGVNFPNESIRVLLKNKNFEIVSSLISEETHLNERILSLICRQEYLEFLTILVSKNIDLNKFNIIENIINTNNGDGLRIVLKNPNITLTQQHYVLALRNFLNHESSNSLHIILILSKDSRINPLIHNDEHREKLLDAYRNELKIDEYYNLVYDNELNIPNLVVLELIYLEYRKEYEYFRRRLTPKSIEDDD